jgi:CheY-like chemotaxis protein
MTGTQALTGKHATRHKMKPRQKILAVDDEALNREILADYLSIAGFDVIEADDGDTALLMLAIHPDVDAIVLDRMMPRMDGIKVLSELKGDPRLRDIPVIVQTAAASSEQIVEGIRAGAYYYLTKPYEDILLLGIISAAIDGAAEKKDLRDEIGRNHRVQALLQQGRFRFQTLEEAKGLAVFIAKCCPNPETVGPGLLELLVNAVEHGNLGIDYDQKATLIAENRWQSEIEHRLAAGENRNKFAELAYEYKGGAIQIRIKDTGNGFDWTDFLEISPQRVTHAHGRGIATAKALSFSSLDYVGCGNEVVCTVALDA